MNTLSVLEMHNFKCFAGTTVLALEPKPYAILARLRTDPRRSNYLGKSSLLQAIHYALTGELPPDCRLKSDWITEGETFGKVVVRWSDGATIERVQQVSKSEQVRYFPPPPNEGSIAKQDAASAIILRRMGMSAEDFKATCYIEQRQIARLVLCDDSERVRLVGGWLQLEKLEQAESIAGELFAELASRRDASAQQVALAESEIAGRIKGVEDWLGHVLEPAGLEGIRVQIAKCDEELERLFAKRHTALQAHALAAERAGLEPAAQRIREVARQGVELAKASTPDKESVHANARAAKVAYESAIEARTAAQQAVAQRRSLVAGTFDGMCPLAREPCPVRAFVEGHVERNRANHDEAVRELGDRARAAAHLGGLLDDANKVLQERARMERQLEDLRREYQRLKPQHDRYVQIGEVQAGELEQLTPEFDAWTSVRVTLEHAAHEIEKWQEHARQHCEQLRQLEGAIRTASVAVKIFGKEGAQRRVAESALLDIEDRANEQLQACGIDLKVKVEWSREGTKLTSACNECGAPFGKSERIKVCERCAAPRGMQIINGLKLRPSDRSGAADDLAGLMVQLGASSWLRADRQSEWGVAMLDELFGQLDEAHRQALASHLPGVLERAGFRQSFTIAHHASVLNALPGRILIESDGKRSTATVVA